MTIIVGAGLSGLIAASMLRTEIREVWEAQPGLPNNHHALLRFKSSLVGDACGIPFRQVDVMKTTDKWRNPVADAISYSLKCTDTATLRSSTTASGQVEKRYIAPSDLINRLSSQIGDKILFRRGISSSDIAFLDGEPIISTIPMRAMMEILDYPDVPDFGFVEGSTINFKLPANYDICTTVYLPNPKDIPYRVSITERELIIETTSEIKFIDQIYPSIQSACRCLGIEYLYEEIINGHKIYKQKYSKITKIDESIRRDFITWASRVHGVYSLGRFATWRPGLLLDDIVQDVRIIQRMINGDNTQSYDMAKGKR